MRAGQRDVRPARTVAGARRTHSGFTPYVTYGLIAVNVIVFVITVVQSRSLMENQVGSKLFADWVLYPPAVAHGQLFRLIGSGFLHFGPIHIAVNMLALYIVGRDVEMVLGRARYLAVYAVSLIGGAALVLMMQQGGITAGASGAIFGLFGAQAMVLIRLRQSPGPVLVIIGINVVISLSIPGISLWGHLGGLAAGTLAAGGLLFSHRLFGADGQPGQQRSQIAGWAAVVAVALVAVILIAVRIEQLRNTVWVG